jgi:hypothetical protein
MTETTEHPSRAATTPEIMQALRLLVDRQREIRHLSGETYETVLPLTALLDLLHRPKDQEELGRQLAEALRQILVSVQATARDVATLVSAQHDQQREVRTLGLRLQKIEASQQRLISGQASLNRTITALSDDLFENESAS